MSLSPAVEPWMLLTILSSKMSSLATSNELRVLVAPLNSSFMLSESSISTMCMGCLVAPAVRQGKTGEAHDEQTDHGHEKAAQGQEQKLAR